MSEVKPSALAVVAEQKQNDLSRRLEALHELQSFDWKALPPHVMAMVLMKKPYRGKSGEPDYYLSPEQALVFAMRCFELGLSPLSSEVWFDRDRWSVNVTLEGKLRLARERGNIGPPQFNPQERPWRKGSVPLAGFEKEPGIECSITVGANNQNCTYLCWMSEWYVASSPVWKAKPLHMLQIRAYDKALAFAAGVGVSEYPSEKEIDAGSEDIPPISVSSRKVEFKPPASEKDSMEDVLQKSIDVAKAGQ